MKTLNIFIACATILAAAWIFRPSSAGQLSAASIEQQQAKLRLAMEAVMTKDHQLSQDMQSRLSSGAKSITAVGNYASALKGLDMSQCPAEFREAYFRHANAWQAMAMQLGKEPQSVIDAVLMGVVNGLRGEFDGGMSRLQNEHDNRVEEVRATWNQVEAVAVRYGAKLTAN